MAPEKPGNMEGEPRPEVTEEEIQLAINHLKGSIEMTNDRGKVTYVDEKSRQDDLKIKEFALSILESGAWENMRRPDGEKVVTDAPGPWIDFEKTIKDWAQQEKDFKALEEKLEQEG